MSIASDLVTLNNTKLAIKASIEGKGQSTSGVPFTGYSALIDNITTSGGGGGEWSRPSDWLALPTVTSSEQKIVILHAVFDHDSNFVAFNMQGNYTVDWGDGSPIENINSGVTADHNYSFSNTALDGTLTTRGYKQAIITITPQSGQNLTNVNFNVRHPLENQIYSSGFLDIAISVPNATALSFRGVIDHRIVERVNILTIGAVTNMVSMFSSFQSLQNVQLSNISAVTSMAYMFEYCYSLKTVQLSNISAVTSMAYMFQFCYSLQNVELSDTSAVTDMAYMFNYCHSLQNVPLFNTSAVTSMLGMFDYCHSLQSVPLFDTSSVTNMSGMFSRCYSLQNVPLFDTSAVTDMSSMFSRCRSLQNVPLFNTSSVTNMSNMFREGYSLKTVPLFNTSAVTDMSSMFYRCWSLSKATLNGTNADISYDDCKLSGTQLNDIFNNLATVTGKTIVISGNYGAGTANISLATAKGWTVVA